MKGDTRGSAMTAPADPKALAERLRHADSIGAGYFGTLHKEAAAELDRLTGHLPVEAVKRFGEACTLSAEPSGEERELRT